MERLPRQELQPSIQSWFIVQSMPEGEAPLDIREQWIGAALPVRAEAPIPEVGVGVLTGDAAHMEQAVPVRTSDAILALSALGKDQAVIWWESYAMSSHDSGTLLFDAECGEFTESGKIDNSQTTPFYTE